MNLIAVLQYSVYYLREQVIRNGRFVPNFTNLVQYAPTFENNQLKYKNIY